MSPNDEQLNRAIDRMQKVVNSYRSLIRRVALGCIACLCSITMNIVVAYYHPRPWVQFILIALAVACVIVFFQGARLLIDIFIERKRIRQVIKKIYGAIPPPK